MPGLRVYLLGTPRLERDGTPLAPDTRKALALAAYLAVTGQPQRRESLAALFWPDYPQARAFANLRRTLWSLNKALQSDAWFPADEQIIALAQGSGLWIDVAEFRARLDECAGHGHPGGETCEQCVAPLEAAAALYRGDFLQGLTLPDSPGFDEWQQFQADDLRARLAGALERIAGYRAARGEYNAAIEHARRRLALDPLHEPAHRLLMQLYAWGDQRHAALRQYADCVRVLKSELGVAPEPETTALYESIRTGRLRPPAGPAAAPGFGREAWDSGLRTADPGLPSTAPRLPTPVTPFIGREPELAEIASLLADPQCRLLTLIGPGGMGKTRLALEFAARQAPSLADGAAFVPLASLASPDGLVPAIAQALGYQFSGRQSPRAQLLRFVAEKRLLLVLDNFEHLLAGADLPAEIVQRAPGVRVLVTSRERLNLTGEWVLEVRGMQFPTNGHEEDITDYSSVQLFLHAARRVDARFRLGPGEDAGVARICTLLQGMPLGLELAAAWVRTLSVQDIAREIERGIDFLAAPLRDLPERHRSLRAVFNHSWALLPAGEQSVFRKLSVFRGGFRREAAQQVAGATLDSLSALVDKSLLRRVSSGRYELHEVLRQYAAERLAEAPGEQAGTQALHSEYFAGWMGTRNLFGPGQKDLLDDIGIEFENALAGWDWAVTHAQEEWIDRYLVHLMWFYEVRARSTDGESAFRRAAAALAPRPGVVLGKVLACQAWHAYRRSRRREALALFADAVAVVQRFGDEEHVAWVRMMKYHLMASEEIEPESDLVARTLAFWRARGARWETAKLLIATGGIAMCRDGREAARRDWEESVALFTALDDRLGLGQPLEYLGGLAEEEGDYVAARARYLESLQIHREVGYRPTVALYLDRAGYVSRLMGDYDDAEHLHQESLVLSRELCDLQGTAGSIDNLGLVAFDRGDHARARELFEEALAIRRSAGDPGTIAVSLRNLGDTLVAQGKAAEGLTPIEESLALRRTLGAPWGIAHSLVSRGEARRALGDAAGAEADYREAQGLALANHFTPIALEALFGLSASLGERGLVPLAVVAQHPSTRHALRLRAEGTLADLAARLGPEAVAKAREQARGRAIEDVMAAGVPRSAE